MKTIHSGPTIVIGVIGADCHAVGNKIIASVLGDLGFNIINLGVMVSQQEFVDAAIKYGAEAILVSSMVKLIVKGYVVYASNVVLVMSFFMWAAT